MAEPAIDRWAVRLLRGLRRGRREKDGFHVAQGMDRPVGVSGYRLLAACPPETNVAVAALIASRLVDVVTEDAARWVRPTAALFRAMVGDLPSLGSHSRFPWEQVDTADHVDESARDALASAWLGLSCGSPRWRGSGVARAVRRTMWALCLRSWLDRHPQSTFTGPRRQFARGELGATERDAWHSDVLLRQIAVGLWIDVVLEAYRASGSEVPETLRVAIALTRSEVGIAPTV